MKNFILTISAIIFLSCSDGHHIDGTGSIQLIGNCKEPLPSMTTYKALGTGTPSDPYLIFSAQQLKSIADDKNAWDKHFEQCADIDASTVTQFRIGGNPLDPADKGFSGSFNGNNYTINKFRYNDPADFLVGLFRSLDKGTLKNIVMKNLKITGDSANGGLVGGMIDGTISDSKIEGNISCNGTCGMLSGVIFSGTVKNIYTAGSIEILTNAAGGITSLVGNFSPPFGSGSTSIENVSSSVNIVGLSGIGGAFGTVVDGVTIKNSYAMGSVTSNATTSDGAAGGFTGSLSGTALIENSFATGNVSGSNTGRDVGGFVGGHAKGTIRNSYATGNVTGNGPVGGFVGVMNGEGIIEDSYATGSVISKNPPAQDGSGGFAGTIGGTAAAIDQIHRCYSSGSVNGVNSDAVGGFVGRDANSAIISDSFSISSVVSTGVQVGPFSGQNNISLSSSYYFSGSSCSGCDNALGNANGSLASFYHPNTSFGFTWDNVNIWNFGAGLPTLK